MDYYIFIPLSPFSFHIIIMMVIVIIIITVIVMIVMIIIIIIIIIAVVTTTVAAVALTLFHSATNAAPDLVTRSRAVSLGKGLLFSYARCN